jgi:hypothetical protein
VLSQNGLFADTPHRHSAARSATTSIGRAFVNATSARGVGVVVAVEVPVAVGVAADGVAVEVESDPPPKLHAAATAIEASKISAVSRRARRRIERWPSTPV